MREFPPIPDEEEFEPEPHTFWYNPAIKDVWCVQCDTVSDYCEQHNPTIEL